MLPKKRRIQRKEFPKILSLSYRYNSPNLLLYSLKIGETVPSRFSFSISKKVSKKAVDRNKIRRRGYSIITSQIKRIKSGYLCFFSFKKGSNSITFSNLEKEIINLLQTSGVL